MLDGVPLELTILKIQSLKSILLRSTHMRLFEFYLFGIAMDKSASLRLIRLTAAFLDQTFPVLRPSSGYESSQSSLVRIGLRSSQAYFFITTSSPLSMSYSMSLQHPASCCASRRALLSPLQHLTPYFSKQNPFGAFLST